MRRFLAFLWPGLLLVCCDKPDGADGRKADDVSEPSATRRRHAPREQTQDKPSALRTFFETADRLESPEAREKAFADIAWSAIESDPALAHEAFQRLATDSPERIRLIEHYAMGMADQDAGEALAWAVTLETELEIAAAKGQIALALAETEPERAANLLSESGITGRGFDVAVVQVIQRWAAQSPPAAGAWVSSFPPGAAREAGVGVIAGQWLPRDAPAAFDWLDTLQDERLRKEAARAMEGVILQQPRHIREAWLQHADARIQSELGQQREQALKDVGDNIPPTAD